MKCYVTYILVHTHISTGIFACVYAYGIYEYHILISFVATLGATWYPFAHKNTNNQKVEILCLRWTKKIKLKNPSFGNRPFCLLHTASLVLSTCHKFLMTLVIVGLILLTMGLNAWCCLHMHTAKLFTSGFISNNPLPTTTMCPAQIWVQGMHTSLSWPTPLPLPLSVLC